MTFLITLVALLAIASFLLQPTPQPNTIPVQKRGAGKLLFRMGVVLSILFFSLSILSLSL